MEKVEKSETLGLIIGRMNPPHNGHLGTIKKALSENQKVLLLLGTPQKRDLEKNPLTFEQRKNLLEKCFKEEINETKLRIFEIIDSDSDFVWTDNVYKFVSNNYPLGTDYPWARDVNFYFGESADSALNCIKENQKYFIDYNFNYIENPRAGTFVEHNGEKIDLSATNFRKALRSGDEELARKFTDPRIFYEIKTHFKSLFF
ncbi:adenylyltransferase/cytidyltransferase family protein [Candidatus Gracilibacteria bacterium]|nr:adenylyltransferase/cytidyltransferase family protein [Candidatus Gracilibacteria bacterium]